MGLHTSEFCSIFIPTVYFVKIYCFAGWTIAQQTYWLVPKAKCSEVKFHILGLSVGFVDDCKKQQAPSVFYFLFTIVFVVSIFSDVLHYALPIWWNVLFIDFTIFKTFFKRFSNIVLCQSLLLAMFLPVQINLYLFENNNCPLRTNYSSIIILNYLSWVEFVCLLKNFFPILFQIKWFFCLLYVMDGVLDSF